MKPAPEPPHSEVSPQDEAKTPLTADCTPDLIEFSGNHKSALQSDLN